VSAPLRFRKKPVVVCAVQNNLGTWKPIIEWLDALSATGLVIPFGSVPPITRNEDGSLNIFTLEGTMRAEIGDWVIQGVKGEFYPCKPNVFEATYEPAENAHGHWVVLGDDAWSIEHPYECRQLMGGMHKCPIHKAVDESANELWIAFGAGRFRITGIDDDGFVEIERPDEPSCGCTPGEGCMREGGTCPGSPSASNR
jgi:hypothetical protein